MLVHSQNWPCNGVLSRLSPRDFQLLAPHLERIDLPVRTILQARNKRVERAYFLADGLASVMANGDHPIEVGIIGRESMTALSVVMGSTARAAHETYMQIAGSGSWMPADALRSAMQASATLHHVLLSAAHAFMMQTMQTALANGRSKIEERLARRLLMAHDRVAGDRLRLTHELLAMMLGVRRSGVTVALQGFERLGLISHRRGLIVIRDRKALEKSSNGAYRASGESP
jgi:CRP-like cAMP-binding protein